MNSFLTAVAWVVLAVSARSAAMTLEDLEKGAAATAVYDPENHNLTEEQADDTIQFLSYIRGYTDAVENARFLVKVSEEEEQKMTTYVPSKIMRDSGTLSASLLNFIRAHRPKGFDSRSANANEVIAAWYLWNCEGADYNSKFVAHLKLVDLWGKDFPGSDEMIGELARGFKERFDRERAAEKAAEKAAETEPEKPEVK
jgi:hypothetical protein